MTIRDVPDATRDRLASRADRAGQSLQEYMRLLLIETAERPTTDEWLDSVTSGTRGGGSTLGAEEIVRIIREHRDGL